MTFDPNKHLIKVQGGRSYLPVSARLIWFRGEHPDWGIETEPITIDSERNFAVFRARIYNAEGRLMAMGTKKEDIQGFGDYIEKAETGAVGRALALCGYGTQFAPELDEVSGGRFADTPRAPRGERAPQGGAEHVSANDLACVGCTATLTPSQRRLSLQNYNAALCPKCQRDPAKNGGVQS